MTNPAQGRFGTQEGGRCAVGSALWEIGIPHDRLLPRGILRGLSKADLHTVTASIPMLAFYEAEISTWYDMMVIGLMHHTMIESAIEAAGFLLHFGRLAGINFIIASPLPKVAKREVACA